MARAIFDLVAMRNRHSDSREAVSRRRLGRAWGSAANRVLVLPAKARPAPLPFENRFASAGDLDRRRAMAYADTPSKACWLT